MSEEKVITISWSRFRSYIECKQKAHLQSKGLRSPAQNVKMFHKGTTVDRILRDWLNEPYPQLGTMVNSVEYYMDLLEQEYADQGSGVVRWDHAQERDNTIAWCKKLLVQLEPIMADLVLPYSYTPDLRFRSPIMIPGLDGEPRQIDLIGALDIYVLQQPGKTAVYDLKATENNAYWKKTIMQLVFYSLAMYARDGFYPSTTALIQPMCADKVLSLKITEEHILSLVSKITQYAHSVWSEDFLPKESDTGCSWCPVKFACSKFAREKGSKRVSFT